MIRKKRYSLSLLLSVLWCALLHAQSFKYEAPLHAVAKTGFYAITITPELSSYLKTDFSDLRIKNDSGAITPYIIKADNIIGYPYGDNTFGLPFTDIPIIKNTLVDSGNSEIILDNHYGTKVYQFALYMKNTSANRIASLSGSDDGVKWYSVADRLNIGPAVESDDNTYAAPLSIPAVYYRYFKFHFFNGNNQPLNILSAKVVIANVMLLQTLKVITRVTANPLCNFKQIDSSNGITYIYCHNKQPYHISSIHINTSGTKFFRRTGDIYPPLAGPSFTISSDSAKILVSRSNPKDFVIKINNGDNPPLKITGITTAQDIEQILAYLDSGKFYHLEMTNSLAVAPDYDLKKFKDSIPYNIPLLPYTSIQPLKTNAVIATVQATSYFTKPWIWAAMLLVLLVMIYFTWSLTKEVGKKQ